jgi:signal transduction histidine kinase
MQRTNHSLNNILKLRKNLLHKDYAEDQVFTLRFILEDVKATLQSNIGDANARLEINIDSMAETLLPYVHTKSIFYNLVTNAIKYRNPERPLVVKVGAAIEHDGTCCFTVEDNGLGMDLQRNKEKLFGIFKRFHDHVEGSGVGLHIVKSIVDAYGGNIEVESEVGKGTKFKISFAGDSFVRLRQF